MGSSIGLTLYLALLAWEDLRTRHVPVILIVSGALAGLMVLAAKLMAGQVSVSAILMAQLPAFIWGFLLLLLSRLSRGTLGKGDGLCFLSFAFWCSASQLFAVLLIALLLAAVYGSVRILLGKQDKKAAMPFLPFVLMAQIFILLLSAFREV